MDVELYYHPVIYIQHNNYVIMHLLQLIHIVIGMEHYVLTHNVHNIIY